MRTPSDSHALGARDVALGSLGAVGTDHLVWIPSTSLHYSVGLNLRLSTFLKSMDTSVQRILWVTNPVYPGCSSPQVRPRSLRPSSCTDTGDAPGARSLPLQRSLWTKPSLSPPQHLALCQARLEEVTDTHHPQPPDPLPRIRVAGPRPGRQGGTLLKSRAWLHLLPGTVILSAGPASTRQSKGRRELVQTPGTHTCHRAPVSPCSSGWALTGLGLECDQKGNQGGQPTGGPVCHVPIQRPGLLQDPEGAGSSAWNLPRLEGPKER